MSLNSQLCECTCSYVQVILKARDVMWYVTLYVTVNSSQNGLSSNWTYSLSLFGLILVICTVCSVCIMYESQWIKSCDDKHVFYLWYSYHSYYGMLWNVPVTQISP